MTLENDLHISPLIQQEEWKNILLRPIFDHFFILFFYSSSSASCCNMCQESMRLIIAFRLIDRHPLPKATTHILLYPYQTKNSDHTVNGSMTNYGIHSTRQRNYIGTENKIDFFTSLFLGTKRKGDVQNLKCLQYVRDVEENWQKTRYSFNNTQIIM